MGRLSYLIAGCLYICSLQLQAQELWPLEKCINHALNESISIQQAQLSILNSEIDLDLAEQARYPNFNANTNVGWNFGRTIEPTTNEFITETFFSNNYNLNSGVVLFNGHRIKNSIKRSKQNLEAARADTDQVKQDLALTIALTYLNVLFSQENIEIAKKQLVINKNQLDQINKSIRAGALPKAESLNLEAQITQSEQAIIVAENAYDLAILQLKQYLRLDPGTEIEVEVPTEFTLSTDPDLITFDELYQSAHARRHDLLAAKLRTESAALDIDIAKSGYYPTLSAFGNLRTNYSNQAREITGFNSTFRDQNIVLNGSEVMIGIESFDAILDKPSFTSQLDQFLSYGFGLGLNVPIYNNGINKGNVQRAELNVQNQKLQRDQLIENLKQNIMQALTDARAAKKKLEATEKSLEAMQTAFENVTKRLDIGASNSFEWETQKTQLENLELNKLKDKYDYLFKVKILDFYLGKPLKF